MQYIFLSYDVDWRREGPSLDHIYARRERFEPAILRYPDHATMVETVAELRDATIYYNMWISEIIRKITYFKFFAYQPELFV